MIGELFKYIIVKVKKIIEIISCMSRLLIKGKYAQTLDLKSLSTT